MSPRGDGDGGGRAQPLLGAQHGRARRRDSPRELEGRKGESRLESARERDQQIGWRRSANHVARSRADLSRRCIAQAERRALG